HEGTVCLLLESRANVNSKRGQYGSALEAAACRGHKNIVLHLIEKGADLHALSGKYGIVVQAA
ncbi:hypothetical protein K438DRAFT_1418917, partial [Mycena galopus ATCC 62051]